MGNKAILLAAALSLALPAFADTSSNPQAPVTKPKTKTSGTIHVDSFAFGQDNSITPASGGNGNAAGKGSTGNIHVKNPCKRPHPPHDCPRPRPPH